MKQSDTTHLFAIPWASQADSSTVSAIPATATAIGRASMALGFPKATMTPLAAGGVPPYGEDMNGILAMLSIAARASEAGLLRPFSADFANSIGGYPRGATVAHPSAQGRFLICVLDGNTNDPGNSMAGWVDPLAGLLSGTAGLAPGDTAGIGLHVNHGTGRAMFGAAGDSWRDLAWGSDVDNLSQQVQEGLQTAVSGTYGLTDGDSPGLGLHTNHTSGKPVYLDKNGSRDLALAADVQGLLSGTYGMGDGDSAGLGLHTNGSTGKPVYLDKTGARALALAADVQGVLSGTAGLAPGDTAGIGLHVNHGTGRAMFGAAGDSWRDLAWGSDVDNLSQQVQEGLQTAVSGTYGLTDGDSPGLGLHTNHTSGKPVYLDKNGSRDLALAADVQGLLSGTYGMGDGDSAGLGLHTNGSTGKPVYLDKTGARALALAADVQGVLSGTAGLAPGDTAGIGLHVNHGTDRPTFGDDGGRWRDLALATDLDSRLPVSSPAASGSLTVTNGGAVMTINPAVTFNNQLRGQISWGTRNWYPGGDGLIMRDNGNLLADATRQTSIQRFTTQGSHGQKIQFPQQFKSDDVQVIVMSMDSGGNRFHTVDRFSVDRYGFSLSINSWNGTGYGIEQRQTVIDVVAFGDM